MASEVRIEANEPPPPHSPKPRLATQSAFHLPGWLFIYAAVLWFCFLLVLEAYLVIRVTYGLPQAPRSSGESLGWLWPWLTLALLIWGGINLAWGLRALRDARLANGFAHFGLFLCCGLGVIGLQALGAARTLTQEPLVLDFTHFAAGPAGKSAAPVAAPAAALSAGDAVEGKKLFAMTCITCHGSSGDGLNNLAPSLRASDFIKSADAAAIRRVVKLGRAITDPANKSGKMMPAKGGNPFLTDQQIAHLVAFVKSLPGSTAPAPVAAADGSAAPPPPQLARWVVPTATAPAGGFIELSPDRELIGREGYERVATSRQNSYLQHLSLAAIAVHGLFLLGLVGVSAHLLFGWLLHVPLTGTRAWLLLIAAGWGVALAAWLLVMGLFPGHGL